MKKLKYLTRMTPVLRISQLVTFFKKRCTRVAVQTQKPGQDQLLAFRFQPHLSFDCSTFAEQETTFSKGHLFFGFNAKVAATQLNLKLVDYMRLFCLWTNFGTQSQDFFHLSGFFVRSRCGRRRSKFGVDVLNVPVKRFTLERLAKFFSFRNVAIEHIFGVRIRFKVIFLQQPNCALV